LGWRDGFDIGFVRLFVALFVWLVIFLGRELIAQFQQAVEVFDGAAMEALGLGLESQERGGDVGFLGEAVEAEGDPEGAVLGEGDLEAVGDLLLEDNRPGGPFHGMVEAIGEEAGFEGIHAEHGVLGEGDTFDGGAFLGVDGLVSGDGAGDEGGEAGAVLDADDGERVGVEEVLAGILGGAGFAFGGPGSGGFAGVGAVGGDAVWRDGHRSRCSMAVLRRDGSGSASDWG
jgi:hypothetical protein